MTRKIQIEPDTYSKKDYDDEDRFIGYWHQINNLVSLGDGSILEIGIGNKFLSHYLSSRGRKIVTLDFDRRLDPMIEGTVLNLPFKEESFDIIACFEVLEHLPYQQFIPALKELRRVSRRNVILSLPDASRIFIASLNIHGIMRKEFVVPFPSDLKKQEHKFDGEHHWEIGKKGYELKRIIRDIQGSSLKIARTYRSKKAPHFRFFTLEK